MSMINLLSESAQGQIVELMHKGDERCPLEIGDRVIKSATSVKDFHKDGDLATVVGSLYIEELKKSCYLVIWDDTPEVEGFVTEGRIEKYEPKNA